MKLTFFTVHDIGYINECVTQDKQVHAKRMTFPSALAYFVFNANQKIIIGNNAKLRLQIQYNVH